MALALPMIVGFTGLLVLPAKTSSNGVLLTLVNQAFPGWFVGIVVVAAAATAMVPAAGLIVAMSSVIARNIVPARTERGQFAVNQASVVVVTGLALTLGLARPDLLANLLLLTFSGLDQLIPAIGLALLARRVIGKWPVVAGLLVGEAIVIWLTFSHAYSGHINVGIVALVPNIAIVGIGAILERGLRDRTASPMPVARLPQRTAPTE